MIYDYTASPTALCFNAVLIFVSFYALLPSMRRDWAQRMSRLLSPTGRLICLEFPMWKPLTTPGPPWGLHGVHWSLLAEDGTGVVSNAGTLSPPDGEVGAFDRVASGSRQY